MGMNVSLTQMLGLPETVECPNCHNTVSSGFDDYDIDCGNCNPAAGEWRLRCGCTVCDHSWDYRVIVRGWRQE